MRHAFLPASRAARPSVRAASLACAACCALLVALGAQSLLPDPAEARTSPLRPLGEGGWSWFGDPRAVYHRGVHRRTYFGWIDREGVVRVSSYDHDSGERTTAVLRRRFKADDHNNPSLEVRPDGRLMVFYAGHHGEKMYYRVSSRPEDVSSWSSTRNVPTNTPGSSGYTYPNPVRLASEGDRLYLFWRGGNWQPTFSWWSGGAWSPARTLIENRGERPYVKYATNGRNRIGFAYTQGHPNHVNSNIYYAEYRRGRVYRAGGTKIATMASLPIRPEQGDEVYDTRTRAWVHDVAFDESGHPVIVFATFRSTDDHLYWYARWTGSRWERHRIVRAGGTISDSREREYSGGLSLDHETPSIVYLSREVAGTTEVETWRTPDGGATWSRTPVTSRSKVENVRPVSPRGLRATGGDLSVIWMRGRYEHFTDYRTNIVARLRGSNRRPVAEARVAPVRGTAPVSVRFDGRRSRDSDGSIVRWLWQFGDGSRSSEPAPSHVYSKPGRYWTRLTVADEDGGRDVLAQEVIVL